MIIEESRVKHVPSGFGGAYIGGYERGYYLSINDLQKIVRDFQADNHDGFVSNDQSYIENWLKNNTHIENNEKKL